MRRWMNEDVIARADDSEAGSLDGGGIDREGRAGRLPLSEDLLAVVLHQLPGIANQPAAGRTTRQDRFPSGQIIVERDLGAIGQMLRLDDREGDYVFNHSDARSG